MAGVSSDYGAAVASAEGLERRAREAEAAHDCARSQLAELEGRHEALSSEHREVKEGLAALQARQLPFIPLHFSNKFVTEASLQLVLADPARRPP